MCSFFSLHINIIIINIIINNNIITVMVISIITIIIAAVLIIYIVHWENETKTDKNPQNLITIFKR